VYILSFAVPGTRNGKKKTHGSRGLYDNKEIRLRAKKKIS